MKSAIASVATATIILAIGAAPSAAANHGNPVNNCGIAGHPPEHEATEVPIIPTNGSILTWVDLENARLAISIWSGAVGSYYVSADGTDAGPDAEFSNGAGGTQGRIGPGGNCLVVLNNRVLP